MLDIKLKVRAAATSLLIFFNSLIICTNGVILFIVSFQHSNTSLERWGEVEAEVKRHFEEAHLSEAFVDRRTYAIPQSTVSSLSTAFTSLEKCRFEATQPT